MVLEPQFDRPYLSASLRDLWGRRWNLSVPAVLRSCVYRPVRARLGPAVEVLAAFVVSGLVHELMFYPPGRTWFFFDFFPGVGHAANEYLLLGRFAANQSRFFFDFFPAASAASSATGCYLFWTMELDLLDLEPVQILPQSSTACY
ncbi:putative long-chain-alcohol O-fatty-acyltransferase 4 [Hordeum vulgare]|nr:putative long-chain-alcohol O-fatty-acyltransferase 4 [Hordeum vulgare]